MYLKIKELADAAIALQNKNRMDEVLREISGTCHEAIEAAYHEAIVSGEGAFSISVDGAGEVNIEHVPAKAKPAKKGGAK